MILMLENLRFRYAFSHRQREAARVALCIAGLLVAFGIVGRMDYEEELRQEAAAALDKAALQQAALLACLNNGKPGYYTIDDKGHRHWILCETYTVSDEGTGKQPIHKAAM